MEFLRRAQGTPRDLAILSAAFHPPTRAHLALAEAAFNTGAAQEVLCVLPRRFPHKEYEDVTLEQRLEMVLAATAHQPAISVGISEGGLFADIAAECRAAYGEALELWFLCGRDARSGLWSGRIALSCRSAGNWSSSACWWLPARLLPAARTPGRRDPAARNRRGSDSGLVNRGTQPDKGRAAVGTSCAA